MLVLVPVPVMACHDEAGKDDAKELVRLKHGFDR
jgi:hypothetical protein